MKSVFYLLAVGIFSGSMAHASLSDNAVDAQEASTALIHCSEEAKQLLVSRTSFLGEVVGQLASVSKTVDIKTILFQAMDGAHFGGPSAHVVAKLLVTVTITHSANLYATGPAATEYSCQLSRSFANGSSAQ
jgi:hypothetical protein